MIKHTTWKTLTSLISKTLGCLLFVTSLLLACGPGNTNNNTNNNTNTNNTNTNNTNTNANGNNNADVNNNNTNNNANGNNTNNNANGNNTNNNANANNNVNANNNNEPPPIPGEMSPGMWGSLKLSVRSYAMPTTFKGDTTLSVVLMGNDLWLGGKSGLYRWLNGKFEQIDDKAVVGLAVWPVEKDTKGLLIARPDGMDVWYNQTIAPSALNYKLIKGEKLQVLLARGTEDLWLGTDQGLRRWKAEKLSTFADLKKVKRLFSYPASKELIVTLEDGRIVVLREEQAGWSIQTLESEIKDRKLEQVMLWKNSEYWGVSGTSLFYRKRGEKDAAWWPFRLRPDKNKPEEWSVLTVTFDPGVGAVWVLAKEGILRLDENEALQVDVKEKFGNALFFRVESDEALWWSDGISLLRLGQDGPVLTYEKEVKTFVESSCLKCHKQGGSAEFLPLGSYDDVRKHVNRMIIRIESKETPMPPPPNQLVGGDAETLRRWIQGGYHR